MAHNNYVAILIECDNVHSLGGSCERDIKNIYERLILNNINPSNIYILTNNQHYFIKNEIKINLFSNGKSNLIKILDEINNLPSNGVQIANSIYIHISGHGYQGPDVKQIELDGRCEQIVLSSGVFADYDFYELLKTYINCNKKLRISVDTCHSGTFSNFTYEIDYDIANNIANNINHGWTKKIVTKKNPYFLNAYSISACSDNQLDSCDIGNVGFGGSLTVHLLENNNFEDFLFGSPIEVKLKLKNILKQLGQEPMLLCDS